MNGPRRLLDQPGPAARLLRAGDTHVPDERARRAALLAAGSAAATLAASGSAAAGGGALLKSALLWLGAGALGGAAISVVATNALPYPSPLQRESTPIIAVAPREPVSVAASPRPAVSGPSSDQGPPLRSKQDSAGTPTGEPLTREPDVRVSVPDVTRAASAPSLNRSSNAERTGSNLYDQLRLIDDARSAAARRDTVAVLAALDRYDQAHPRGQFVPESLALRIETLARAGEGARARALAVQFRRDYPQHPLAARVAAALGD